MAENYAPLPDEWLEEMEELADAEYGRLIRWYQKMKIHGAAEKLCGNERFYTKRCVNTLERFREAGRKRTEDARTAAKKKWEKVKQNAASDSVRPDAPGCAALPGDATNTSTSTNTITNSSSSTNTTTTAGTTGEYNVAVVNARTGACESEGGSTELDRVLACYMDKVNPSPSQTVVGELESFLREEGLPAEVVIHAIGTAIDERKTSWSYIRGILRRYARDRLTTMRDVLDADQKFRERKENKNDGLRDEYSASRAEDEISRKYPDLYFDVG